MCSEKNLKFSGFLITLYFLYLVSIFENLEGKWVVVVLRSPIHANEPSEYNGMLYRTSNRVLNNGIKVIILICMDGTSQYHHHRKRASNYADATRANPFQLGGKHQTRVHEKSRCNPTRRQELELRRSVCRVGKMCRRKRHTWYPKKIEVCGTFILKIDLTG